ncbi:unnamed protein product [Adineta ricciae]|uniref:Uncharacterized protein n=1 Tax=Adineta ricciae TaxID=249248 RepID=A0A814XM40_ADIRI|nr:unnamed protein product [Adineta ricciae]
MVRYVIMKRITQILASVLFVITVLTIYIAFDFAVNNAVSKKHSSHKRSAQNHDHIHEHNDIKITKRRSVSPQLRRSNRTIKHADEQDHQLMPNENRTQKSKQRQKVPLNAKPGAFHKGKTGVKVNKPRKLTKDQRKRSTTTTLSSRIKVKGHLNDKQHV